MEIGVFGANENYKATKYNLKGLKLHY